MIPPSLHIIVNALRCFFLRCNGLWG